MSKTSTPRSKYLNPQTYIDAIQYRVVDPFQSKETIKKNKFKQAFRKAYKEFELSGKTSEKGMDSLLNLYCLTNGKFTDEMHRKIQAANPPRKTSSLLKGVIGDLNKSDFDRINTTLNAEGYVRFDKKLDPAILRRIYQYALETPAKVQGYDKMMVYDINNPISETYRVSGLNLINNEDFQSLIMDPTLINMVRNYFGSEPIFDWTNLWWVTNLAQVPSSEAAQLYHFDFERIKWLIVFFYVTDVDTNTGPHCYIRGSHVSGNKPMDILKRGYVRIEDAELKNHYPEQDFIEVCGESGSIFAGDTKCWHKAKHLKKGHRLIFQLEYTNSLFGINRPKMIVNKSSVAFREFCRQNKTYASSLHFE